MTGGQPVVCVTCADELRSVVVRRVDDLGHVATVIDAGETQEVSIELVDDVRIGDRLLVHGGVALQRAVPPEERERT